MDMKQLFDTIAEYREYKKELINNVPLTSDDNDSDVTEKIDCSRIFMLNIIKSDLPYAMKKRLIKKWTKQAFKGLTSQKQEYKVYPLMFFTALFANGSELQEYQYMRYEYMKFIAEYVYFHKRDIRNMFLENSNEMSIPVGFDAVYEEFRRLLAMYHPRCMAVLICLLMSAILFFGGILIGLNSGYHRIPHVTNVSVTPLYENVSDNSEESENNSEESKDNETASVTG